ncbi:protease pro-enzyme activation domain-containing protein [Candidatus Binatus sp.]|uniref:protease pro-enzyme activation domain-containing protein n=1 Tax=Candidatus Binatus sp. TaxID=2811406 RepID=UPI003C452BD0
MFFLLMIVYSPCAWPALALAADSEPMVSLPGGVPPQASQLLAAATPAPAGMPLRLRIYLNLSNPQAARQMIEDLQNPSSPNYHKWLKTGQFDQMFGPLQASYDAIASWLTSQGFSVTAVRHDRRDIEFTGTVAQADQAFQVQIMSMSDGKHYGILSDPMIPTRFQGVILGVMGLDNLGGVSPASTVSPVWTLGNSNSPNGTAYTAFAPADFYTFYDENALLKAGVNGSISGSPNECLAIVGLSDYLPAAVNAFDTQFNLPTPTITTEYATNNTDPGITHDENEGEALLDLEWGHAAAPGAPLILYVGDASVDGEQALLDALELAVSDSTCGTISISFQVCDFTGFGYAAWDIVAQAAAAQGQSVFVASGDFGDAGYHYDFSTGLCLVGPDPGVNEISADTYVTSVGGTQFYPSYAGINGVPLYGQVMGTDVGFGPEGVWDVLGSGASGGGESQEFTKPNYQVLSTPADGWRDVPDVALMAGALDANGTPNPGAFYGDDPQISGSYCPGPGACVACCEGGTSLATVLWAGISKLIQQQLGARLGNINPELYSLAQLESTAGLRDVTVNAVPNNNGFNGVAGWPARNGYDLATGWGTPDITTLVNLFGSSQVVLIGGLAASEYLQTAEAYNPVTQSFTSLGTVMSTNRVSYAAAKLPDGTFLLAGGDNGSSSLKTADIFNPVTDTYAATTHNMADADFDFAQAVSLDTGQVFIIGTGNAKLWTEIYDPPTQTFSTPVKILGSPYPEVGYTTTLLGSGKVLIQGYRCYGAIV